MEIDSLKMFRVVSEYLNITQAASVLDISQPALSRRIKQLENHFGAMLLYRRGSSIELTSQGAQLLHMSQRILDDYETMAEALISHNDEVEGRVIIGAPAPILRWLSESLLPSIVEQYPDLNLDLRTVSPLQQTSMSDCDLLITPRPLEDASLIGHKLSDFSSYFCATNEYLERYGEPQCPTELSQHRCINYYPDCNQSLRWHWQWRSGESGTTKLNPFIIADSADIAAQWMRCGLGITLVPKSQMRYQSKQGSFEVLFEGRCVQKQQLHLMHRSCNSMTARFKVIVDRIIEFIGKDDHI